MSNTTTQLSAQKRERTGSRYAQRVRSNGGLPAVVYGHKQEPVSISLDAHEAIGHISKGEKLFELDIEGAKQHVLLKDLGYDYLGTNIIHADFSRVNLDERVDVNVPLRFVGEAKGLKTMGAIMMHPNTEIEVNCLITNLPNSIEVRIGDMDVGDVLYISDVVLPMDSIKLVSDPEDIVAQIVLKAEEEEEAEGEATEIGAEGTEPEVISEKKEEDGE